jgi:EAL domain-containing protein (putative c-di-GMP-specific phosphodiesterase class I)
MWSSSFEIPVLMILGIILLFYFSRPRLPVKRNSSFLLMILAHTLTIIFDVHASALDNYYTRYPVTWVNIANMMYFIFFFIRAYTLFYFVATVTKDNLEKSVIIRNIVRIPMCLAVLVGVLSAIVGSSEFTKVIYYVDKDGYHVGELYNILYFVGGFYGVMSFISSIIYRKRFGRKREKYGLILYNLIILMAYVVRWLLPHLLIMDTIIVLAILLVYLAFINPEYLLDLGGVCFNTLGLSEHLEENIENFRLAPYGISVSDFVEMRDIYGVNQMEEGLIMIARFLRQTFPGGVIFYCRNGRFVILDKPNIDFEGKMEKIRERFRSPWKNSVAELYLSVGFVTFEMVEGKHEHEILMKTMVRALERAGKLEKEKFINVSEKDIKRVENEKMVRLSIESAIESSGFELFLQPIYDAKTGKAIGAEALSRIRDPEGNIIPPSLFIPVAENSGRINELGELVFDRTCRFIKDEGLEKIGINWVNVNLSPAQFIRTDLAERYAAIAKKHGVNPEKVHLEITEGATIDDSFLQKQIAAISEKGFKFVLDDYGTGYSNLARLKKCPFINVKLDMTIVWDFCKKPDAILPNMVRTFKNMGFSITAEGIEDENMVKIMSELGCDYLQGYYYSKPVSAREFVNKYAVNKQKEI